METGSRGAVTLALAGDVMLGRGVDQVLAHPGDPVLHEQWVRDAREYVALAEAVNGPVPQPVDATWPWGDALDVLDDDAAAGPDPQVRVVNLETAVTRSGEPAPGKGVHYRMTPENLDCLAAARPDVTVLANNHVLDWGRDGLLDTLDALAAAGLRTAGAGRDAAQAWRPADVGLPGGGRVRVVGVALPSSGVPASWAAGLRRPGVALVPEPTRAAADAIAERLRDGVEPGDVAVASVHGGSNWGWAPAPEEVRFAHRLVDRGVAVVHGHSSHHPRPVEVRRGRLVLHGCGDLVDDYEGIRGHEQYRPDLRLLHLATLDRATGTLRRLRMVPLRSRRLRLERASAADTAWLADVLDRAGRGLGARVRVAAGADGDAGHALEVVPEPQAVRA